MNEWLNSITPDSLSTDSINPFQTVSETLTIVIFGGLIITALFLILWLLSLIRRNKEHKAILSTASDIKVIREIIERHFERAALIAKTPSDTLENSTHSDDPQLPPQP